MNKSKLNRNYKLNNNNKFNNNYKVNNNYNNKKIAAQAHSIYLITVILFPVITKTSN